MKPRVAIFGGSFDPVHYGHLLVAQAALEELRLDRLVFVPAAQSPFKPDTAPAPPRERLRLLRLALAGKPRLEIDEREIRRGGVSYTVDTIRELNADDPGADWFYLIGADHLNTLHQWKDASALAALVSLVVFSRPGAGPAKIPEPFRGHELRGYPFEVSSSAIRDRVRNALPIDWLTPPPVAEAIANNQLYL